jgi:superfamily II DNA/RNA helicase
LVLFHYHVFLPLYIRFIEVSARNICWHAGRCARAGRSGIAYSLVAHDEFAYLLDLHLFLGRPFNASRTEAANKDGDFPDGFIGRIPEVLLEEEHSELKVWHETENDLVSGKKCIYKMRAQTQF